LWFLFSGYAILENLHPPPYRCYRLAEGEREMDISTVL
jgi:hypothetical protein